MTFEIETLRATKEWQRAGAYSVRIQGMNRQHNISLEEEIDEHDNSETKYIVLLDHGYPVATCRFYDLGDGSVMLGRVVVLPEYRGKKLGNYVVEQAEAWIKELGYRRIEIESRIEARNFYEKLGYAVVDDNAFQNSVFTCVKMAKSV